LFKEIVGATVSCALLIYTLWFIVPSLKTSYNVMLPSLNTTSPTMQTVLTIANSWFLILPLFVLFVGGFTIFLYLSRRGASDYE